jgi:GNAT superfamily N-acetyltransferase
VPPASTDAVVTIREESISALSEHARVSIAYLVEREFDVVEVDGGIGGLVLREREVALPCVKDYDAISVEGPTRWAKRFDVSNWGLIGAHKNGDRIGGAVIAFNTADVNMLEGRSDLSVLWDIRVAPQWRGQGVGALLFEAVVSWSRDRGCRQLKVETQNNNVAACRFYARQGCVLGAIDRFAYPDLPAEVQLLWYKDLDSHVAAQADGVRDAFHA